MRRKVRITDLVHATAEDDVDTAAGPGPGSEASASLPKEGTAEWYMYHKFRLLAGEGSLTVLSYCYVMLSLRLTGGMGKSAFNSLLYALSRGFGDAGRYMPPSVHLMHAVVDKKDWTAYMYHVCPGAQPNRPETDKPACPGFVYDWLDPKDWAAHADDTCGACGRRRWVSYHAMHAHGQPVLSFLCHALPNSSNTMPSALIPTSRCHMQMTASIP